MSVVQFKCPNCGGELKFNPNSANYKCEYCLSIFDQEQLDKIEDDKTADIKDKKRANPDNISQADLEKDLEKVADVYNCPSCGAEIVTDASTAATFCYYCHNPVVLAGKLDGSYTPDYVVPFKIDRQKAEQIFSEWMAKKKFVPKSFYNKSQIDKISGVYFPYMLYKCKIDGKIDAEATKTTISNTGNIEYTETARYHVMREGNMELKHVTRNALSSAKRELVEGVLPFDMNQLKPFRMSYLSGFLAQKRDLGKENFQKEVEQEVKDYAVESLKNSVAGYSGINITANNTVLADPSWEYALMPVWTLTYNDKAKNKIYYFSINGQSGKTIGELPVDNKKLVTTFMMIFAPIAVILMVIGYFL